MKGINPMKKLHMKRRRYRGIPTFPPTNSKPHLKFAFRRGIIFRSLYLSGMAVGLY